MSIRKGKFWRFSYAVKEMIINWQIRVFHTFPDDKISRSREKLEFLRRFDILPVLKLFEKMLS